MNVSKTTQKDGNYQSNQTPEQHIPEPDASALLPYKKTAYIAGCVRNCATHLHSVFKNIKKIATQMDDFTVIIAYDHSTDGSLDILKSISTQSPFKGKMHILINNDTRFEYRTQNIAKARNSVLSFVFDGSTRHPFFIWIDCDDVCSLPLNTELVLPYLERHDWDVITFNRPIYYDVWALSYEPFVVSCWSWGNASRTVVFAMRDDIKERLAKLMPDELMYCNSAFNGFGIYRTEKMKGCTYDWKCEALALLPRKSVNECVRRFGCMPTIVKEGMEIEDCEHKSFHKQMREKHGARICISPHIVFG